MKITQALIGKLIRLRDGEALPASALKGDWVETFLREGVLVSRSHGSRYHFFSPNRDAFLAALDAEHEGLANLERFLPDAGVSRADLAADGGDSKLLAVRTFPGFPVNAYEPIAVRLKGKPFVISPPAGSFVFIADWRELEIPGDVVVMGIENAENFREIRAQRSLFESVLPGKRLLFVSRYPQSTDLRDWLKGIPNPYYHFGDFDLAGLHIFEDEFYRHLGDRAMFFTPPDYRARLRVGSRRRYDDQYAKSATRSFLDARLSPIAEAIHSVRRCYDQEGWIGVRSLEGL